MKTICIFFLSFYTVVCFAQPQNNQSLESNNHTANDSIYSNSKVTINCQPFTVKLNSTFTSHEIIDTNYMNVCPGDTVVFVGEAIFNSLDPVYNQTQSNTQFIWKFADINPVSNILISRTFNSNHGVEMKMYAFDTMGCLSSNEVNIIVRVSGNPIVAVNNPVSTTTGLLTDVSVGYDQSHVITIDTVNQFVSLLHENQFLLPDTQYIPDGTGTHLLSTININSFPDTDSINYIIDLIGINMTLEHSFLEDLSIVIICPTGASAILKQQTNNEVVTGTLNVTCSNGGSNKSLGSSNDASSGNCVLEPGIGWNYEFRPGAENCFGASGPTVGFSYTNGCGITYTGIALIPSVPNSYTSTPTTPVYYGTYESLSNLIGCPLNGDWTLKIKDYYGVDNGFLFSWGIQFAPYFLPIPTSYSLNVDSVSWYGNNITSTGPFTATLTESNVGVYSYGAKIYDEYGCVFDTTFAVYCFLNVEENATESIPVHFFPNPVSSDLHYTILNELWENSTVSILSIQGVPIYKTQITNETDHFNVNFLTSGNYLIKVQNPEGKEYTVKIVVTK